MSAARFSLGAGSGRRLCLAAALATLLAAAIPSPASGDADPASDFLLVAPTFYPYQPPASPALKKVLEATLTKLKAKGLNLKVAMLDDPTDLGGVTNLWAMPQRYADFLDSEISFNQKQPLLVVMPAGFGVSHAGPQGALNGVLVDSTHGADGLVRSAIQATVRLAKVNGKAIPAPVIPAAGSTTTAKSSGTSPLLTFGAPVLLVVLVAAVTALMRRREVDDDDQPGTGSQPA
jgi:hypothetical protein